MKLSTNLAAGRCLLSFLPQLCGSAELPPPALVANGAGPAGRSPAGASHTPVVSADGRYVAFVSMAPNLVPSDANGRLDVFRCDRTQGRIELVSVKAAGTAAGNGTSPGMAMSADGSWIAFESQAGDLVAGDANGASDVFLRDLASGRTMLVSHNAAGSSGNGASTAPQITPDGRWVLFASEASDLVSGDTNGVQDLFRYQTDSQGLERVSVMPDGFVGTTRAEMGVMTPDGRLIVFQARYVAGVGAGILGWSELFARDRTTGQTARVSERLDPDHATDANSPALSADGRFAAFLGPWQYGKTAAGTAAPVAFFIRDLTTGVTRGAPLPATGTDQAVVCQQRPSPSADGSRVAWSGAGQVYVWDAADREHRLVSGAADGSGPAAGGESAAARISPDGRFVWFLSWATNLVNPPPPAGGQLYRRDLTAGQTVLVSAASTSAGAGNVADWDVTADQNLAVFESSAATLVPEDFNGEPDIFARALEGDTFERVSTADAAVASRTRPGLTSLSRQWTGSLEPTSPLAGALSADGRWLAFLSSAPAGEAGERAGFDVIVADLEAATNFVAARAPRTPEVPLALVQAPQLSADGRTLVFASAAADLVPGDTNGWPDVFKRDLVTGETTLVSAYPPALAVSNACVVSVALERGGRWVAFARLDYFASSKGELWLRDLTQPYAWLVATNGGFFDLSFTADGRQLALVSTVPLTGEQWPFSPGLNSNCYLLDLAAGTFELVSQGGPNAHDWITATTGKTPALSAAAQRVAYLALGSDLGSHASRYDLFLRDRRAARTMVLTTSADGMSQSHDARDLSISRDGRRVAFTSDSTNLVAPGWVQAQENVFLRAVDEQFTTLVSVNANGSGPGNAPSREAHLSPSGRFVLFRSAASNLVAGDTNGVADLFLRDVDAGTPYPVGQAPDGTPPDAPAGAAIWSDDSRVVVFESHAAYLGTGDLNPGRDLFALRLAGPDTDGDGLDDDWEMTYFSTLARDGTGDFDQDGATDLEEFRAGTHPTRDESVLRALTVAPVGQGAVTVMWQAVQGRRYVVQACAQLGPARWRTLPGVVTAAGDTASYTDEAPAYPRQFYRVLAVP